MTNMGRLEQPMMTRKLEEGSVLYQEGKNINEICIVIKGSIKTSGTFGENILMAGHVIGMLDLGIGKYLYNYIANEELLICYFSIESIDDIVKILTMDSSYPGIMISSLSKQMINLIGEFEQIKNLSTSLYHFINQEYLEYKEVCAGYHKEPALIKRIESLEEFEEDSAVVTVDLDYYINLDLIPLELKKKFYSANEYVTMAEVRRIHEYTLEMKQAYEFLVSYINNTKDALFAKDEDNLFMRLAELAFMLNEQNGDISLVWSRIKNITAFVSKERYMEQSVLPILIGHFKTKIKIGADLDDEQNDLTKQYTIEQIKGAKVLAKDSLDTILEFAEISDETANKFKQYLTVYHTLSDKSAMTEEADKLRKAITKLYYEIYELVFFKAEESQIAEPVIDLFLNYGYVDERFVTESQLLQLFYLKKEQETCEYPIYTMREWLQQIYYGKAEPSKNEFDLDYQGVLRDRKKSQRVSEAEERTYLADVRAKVTFEIENMFRSANKITSGKVLTFCPVLHKDLIVGSIDKLIMKKSMIAKAFDDLQKIDFSLFYRSIMYHDSSKGITKEYIEKKVLPITILMPNVGTKSTMWQETSGLKKDTSARFVMPVLSKESIDEMLLSVVGRYRWEICRNIQGIYWSDISEKSLTSEYYDYIQFYKKNRELSVQAKEKIRNEIARVRNNYREVFVQDYIQWIKYESKGSSRLNKIARTILMTYCPFPREIRSELVNFPAFAELLDRYEILQAAKIKKLENAYLSIRKSGGTITKELEENLEFHKR